MTRYSIGLLFWGLAIIFAEVVKWKAAEQFCLIWKTVMMWIRLWMKGV